MGGRAVERIEGALDAPPDRGGVPERERRRGEAAELLLARGPSGAGARRGPRGSPPSRARASVLATSAPRCARIASSATGNERRRVLLALRTARERGARARDSQRRARPHIV